MTKKVTKRERFEELLTIAEVAKNEELVAFIKNEIELLNKKNARASEKPTATQKANTTIKEAILEALAATPNTKYTISEMQKNFEACAELSNQKISALVRQLQTEGKVERTEEKRKAYFSIIL